MKANYATQISNAITTNELDEIVIKAQNESDENEKTQKTLSKNKISEFSFLESDKVKNYREEIDKALDIESIKKIVENAQLQNEELKANKKELTKEEITKLEFFCDAQQEYIEKLESAKTEEEFNQILEEAKAKNEELKSNANPDDSNKGNTNTTAVAIAVPIAVMVVAVAVVIVVVVVRRKKQENNKIYDKSPEI